MTASDWPPDLEQLIALLQADAAAAPDEEPPPALLKRAQLLLRQRRQPSAGIRHLIAQLMFNSAQHHLAAGVRALDAGDQQLVFQAGEYELDLRLSTDGVVHAIRGQVLGPCSGAGVVRLSHPTLQLPDVPLTDLCEFALDAVPAGSYSLTVHVADTRIEVPALELGGA